MPLRDQPALKRIDSTYSLPFLSACAAALHEHGLLSELDGDALRLALKERHRQLGEGQASLFSELLAERSPLVVILEARCGSYGLGQIMMSWTAARLLEQTVQGLETLADGLLRKAELMFNQVFFLYQGDQCERRSVFSFFLVDFAEQIHASARSLAHLSEELRSLVPVSPRGSDNYLQWEQILAQHLGFRVDTAESVAPARLQESLKKLCIHFELLADRMAVSMEQLNRNLKTPLLFDRLQLLLEDWSGQLGQLRSMPLAPLSSLERMEKRRIRLLNSLTAFHESLGQQQEILFEALKPSSIQGFTPALWPEAERREILTCLLRQGVAFALAEAAVRNLQMYCQQHAVSPELLLDTELNRIHPSLSEPVLQILQKLAKDRDGGPQILQEKQSVLKRKDRLLQALHGASSTLALVLCMTVSWLPGCGIKTAPRSEVLDLRPAVPYHAEQRSNPKLQNQAEAPAKK